jgi:hypothetical protein
MKVLTQIIGMNLTPDGMLPIGEGDQSYAQDTLREEVLRKATRTSASHGTYAPLMGLMAAPELKAAPRFALLRLTSPPSVVLPTGDASAEENKRATVANANFMMLMLLRRD